MMLVIIAHHYIVNSGVVDMITSSDMLNGKELITLIAEWGKQ